jgi:hypothetical protein
MSACTETIAVDERVDVLAETCGREGSVALLVLSDDERVEWTDRVNDDGDLYVTIGPLDRAQDGPFRRVVIDVCGDDAVDVVAPAAWLKDFGDTMFGCVDSDLVQFAGPDDPAPRLLAVRGCAVREVGGTWVTTAGREADAGADLWEIRVSGSDVELRPLLQDIRVHDGSEYGDAAVVQGQLAYVQTADLAVHAVDPGAGTSHVVIAAAHSFTVGPAGIVYRPPIRDGAELAPLLALDPAGGAVTVLADDLPASWRLGVQRDACLNVYEPGPGPMTRWFCRDPWREVQPPAGHRIVTIRAGGTTWLRQATLEGDTTEQFSRWREGESPRPVMTCEHCFISSTHAGDFIDVMVAIPTSGRFEVWRIDDAAGEPRRLSDEVSDETAVLPDGRLLTVLHGHSSGTGPLVLEDTSGPVTLEPRVRQKAPLLTQVYGVPGDIVYETVPEEDGIHGLFRARLRPPE